MKRLEREVYDPALVSAMLDEMNILNLGMNDEDGTPYIVPLSFGYEMAGSSLVIYFHCRKDGKKVDLLRKDPRVCAEFSIFNDFPDKRYKGHYHDYRSVIAKGKAELISYEDDPVLWERGYDLLYTCNHRDIKPLSERKAVPAMYIGVIRCPFENVTAKSEFPIRSREDVPFVNVYERETDEKPFDLSDIISDRRARQEKGETGIKRTDAMSSIPRYD